MTGPALRPWASNPRPPARRRRDEPPGGFVAFLAEHDPSRVLRAFLDATPGLVAATSRAGLHELVGRHGRQLLAAAREVTGDYYEETQPDRAGQVEGGHESEPTTCPVCGAEVTGQFPVHLARDCDSIDA